MSVMQYRDFEAFLLDDGDRLFRYWVYKRSYTPIEWDKKYIDQTEFDSAKCHFGFIRESIALPNGDFLLGIQEIFGVIPEGDGQAIDYYKLSELRLCYYPEDAEEFEGG